MQEEQHENRFRSRKRSRKAAESDDETLLETPPRRPSTQRRHAQVHLSRRKTQAPIDEPVDQTSLLCGLIAGVTQAGIFNPYDRALYLSIVEKRPFLSLQNWKTPYSGFFQSIGIRALSGGLYFPVEHFFLRLLDKETTSPMTNLVAGTAAGAVNAMVINPLSAIKYKTWGRTENRGLWAEATGMLQKSGGFRPFLNGLVPTIYRDVVFGGCYTWIRLQIQAVFDLQPNEQWKANFVAAGLATMASGPFNYVRTLQYATRSRDRADTTFSILRDLTMETRQLPTTLEQLHFLQNRLRIGWGTMRVAMGMTLGHAVYDWLQVYTYQSSHR